MYTTEDSTVNNARLKKGLIFLIALLVICIALLVPTLINRVQWASDVVSCVTGAIIIFFWNLKFSPLLKYRRFLKDIGNGLSHENTCEFVSLGNDLMTRDGVKAYLLEMSEGPKEKGEDIRQFYWDAAKPRPNFTEGEMVKITSHGGFVIDYQTAQ